MSDRFQQKGMRNGVEKGADVKVQHPVLRPAPAAAHGQRVMGAAPRTVPVAVAVEDRLQYLLQQHRRRSLRHPVTRIGDGRFILTLLQPRVGMFRVDADLCGQAVR